MMFGKFFDLQHPFWRLMGFLSDMMLLTLIWAFFTIPIVTIGPSTSAFFKVCNSQLKKKDQGVLKNFYTSFITYWRRMTLPGIILLMTTGMLVTSIYFYHMLSSQIATFLLFVSIIILVVFLSVLSYVLPLSVIIDDKLLNICKFAFVLSIYNIQWTFLLFITNVSGIFLTVYVAPYTAFFSISLLGILNTKIVTYLYEESSLNINVLH